MQHRHGGAAGKPQSMRPGYVIGIRGGCWGDRSMSKYRRAGTKQQRTHVYTVEGLRGIVVREES